MKSMKKLVLAGLVLLASVMVLVGCKNDSVPEVKVPPKLESISVSPPNKTVYSVGEGFDTTGMVVTASYDDGTKKTVEGIITPASSEITKTKEVDKCITVSYTEGGTETEASFSIDVVDPSVPTKLTNYISPNNTDDTWTYVAFGEWPQSEAKNVKENSLKVVDGGRGYFKDNYYKDDNNNCYVKQGDKYYKLEPIVWRVLNKDYASTGRALLLAENILTGGRAWDDNKNNYMESNIRKWLNGNSGSEEVSDYNGDAGFLQTAFTEIAGNFIASITVDNSAQSTSDATGILAQDTNNACKNTKDKIFLLSEQEATMLDYGFANYIASGQGNTRIRVTTDYAEATGASQSSTENYGGWWWLRSPVSFSEAVARGIRDNGSASEGKSVLSSGGGVVPALCIKLQ